MEIEVRESTFGERVKSVVATSGSLLIGGVAYVAASVMLRRLFFGKPSTSDGVDNSVDPNDYPDDDYLK